MNNVVTCLKCAWVSFAVSKAQAQAEIKQFNEYYDTLPKSKQELYYRNTKPTPFNYTCLKCGGAEFRPTTDGEVPNGCTLNPVICDEFADSNSTKTKERNEQNQKR